jgi:ABC-type glycerol-3-phosphate transport system substrate-binding protein
MKIVCSSIVRSSIVAAFAATALAAAAQTSPGASAAPTVQHTPAGIDYISGGAGEEDRTAMSARQAEFPFKIVLSASGGAYLVAEKLSVLASQGALVTVRDAGPIVMLKLPPGSYTLEATSQGRTERRTVRVGNPAQTLNWQFPG